MQAAHFYTGSVFFIKNIYRDRILFRIDFIFTKIFLFSLNWQHSPTSPQTKTPIISSLQMSLKQSVTWHELTEISTETPKHKLAVNGTKELPVFETNTLRTNPSVGNPQTPKSRLENTSKSLHSSSKKCEKTPYQKLLEQIEQKREVDTHNQNDMGGRIFFQSNQSVGRYHLHETLGTGTFSNVHLATHQLTKGERLTNHGFRPNVY